MHTILSAKFVSTRVDKLTHWGLVTPYDVGDEILVNTGSGNGLLPNSTKPLPETMLTYQQ